MARLTDNVRAALGEWWTLAQAAGYGDYTATDTITAAADLASQAGQSLSFGESSAIATLFGYARRMSNAAEIVQSLEREDVITPAAIATPPWARDEQEIAALPMWHVHFDFTYTNEAGDTVTERRVSVFRMTLPDTMGELQDAVTADAQAMAAKYGVDFIGADVREIHSI